MDLREKKPMLSLNPQPSTLNPKPSISSSVAFQERLLRDSPFKRLLGRSLIKGLSIPSPSFLVSCSA